MFNLVMTANPTAWDSNASSYDLRAERFLEFTSPDLIERFSSLESAQLEELKSIPTLFAYEITIDKAARLGRLLEVARNGDRLEIKLRLDEAAPTIAREDLVRLRSQLDINEQELTRTHWAIKNRDIGQALNTLKPVRPIGTDGEYLSRFWHCAVETRSDRQQAHLLDLTFAELRQTVLQPWHLKSGFVIDGRLVRHPDEVASIRIAYTSREAHLYGEERAACARLLGAQLDVQKRVEAAFRDGYDATQELLFSVAVQAAGPQDAIASLPNSGQGEATELPTAGIRDTIFVAYSHANRRWLERLKTHIKPLQRDGKVLLWADTELQIGTKWRKEIETALESATIAILLVSADFLASDFIAKAELPTILKAEEERGLLVVPVFVAPTKVPKSLLAFTSVNRPNKTLTEVPKPASERVFVRVVELIDERLATLQPYSGPRPG